MGKIAKNYKNLCFLTLLILLITPHFAQAGAWTQAIGKAQLITTSNYYQTSQMFNAKGKKSRTDKFSKTSISPYFEYGLYEGTTIGFSSEMQYLQSNTNSKTMQNYGIGNSAFFIRERLIQKNNWVLSWQPEIKIPPYYKNNTQFISADGHGSLGSSLLVGYNFQLLGQTDYISSYIGYVHRFAGLQDQLQTGATLGININNYWQIQPEINATFATQDPLNFKNLTLNNNIAGNNNYNLTKAQISAIYSINNNSKIQMGGFTHISGKNTGAGNGGLVALWTNF